MIFQVQKNKKPLLSEDLALEMQLFTNADNADRPHRQRAIRNYVLYAPTDDWNTWDSSSAETLRREERPPNYYNFMQMYVEGNAGNFVINKIDPNFVDREDDSKDRKNELIRLKNIFYADKDHFDYSANHLSSIVNGCIAIGIEEIKIVRSIEEPRGRIAFKSLPSVSVIFDPNNLTDNIAGGSQNAWKRFYLTPKQMCSFFEDTTDEIRMRLRSLAKDNPRYEAKTDDFPIEKYWGGQYEVVEHYHIEPDFEYVTYDSDTNLILPNSSFKYGSEEDWHYKKIWAEMQGITVLPENVKEVKVPTEALWVTTFCPQLGIHFENRKDERQIKNKDGTIRLPFYTWSYITKNGKWTSLVDLGKNLQDDINKRESFKTKILTKTAVGGKTVIHPLAYGDNDQKYQEIVRDHNDPSKILKLDSDAPLINPELLIHNIPGTQLNAAIFTDESSKMSMMDRILRLPLAMQGSGKSGTSGVLFGRQVIEGNIMQKIPATTLEQYQNDKYTGWLSLATKLYIGTSKEEMCYNYNRKFYGKEGSISINEYIGISDDGNDMLDNKIGDISTVEVIVSQSKDNDYMKQAKREVDIALLQAMPLSPTNMGYRAITESDLVKNMDGITNEQLAEIEEMSKLSIEIAKKQLIVQNMQLDSAIQQVNQVQQQAQIPVENQAVQGNVEPINNQNQSIEERGQYV